jgi:hypothetical protein
MSFAHFIKKKEGSTSLIYSKFNYTIMAEKSK